MCSVSIAESNLPCESRTSVKWHILNHYLKSHPDRQLVSWCIEGFKHGFNLGLTGTPQPWPDPPNSAKVRQYPKITWDLIKDEISKGFILGPFRNKLLPNLICVPINIVEKETSSGLFRLIQDFSYPWQDRENGINALVPKENKTVTYSGIDDVAWMALDLGPHSWAMRIDIKHTFKCLPLAPSQWHLTGFTFLGAYFIQTQTPFGASASCLNFERVARLLRWIIQNEYPSAGITNYLDDFWLTQKTEAQLTTLSNNFLQIVEKELGFPISHNKTIGPAQVLDFVGLTVDLINLRVSLPRDKTIKSLKIINILLTAHDKCQYVSVKDLEKCTGILNYACQAIPIGRPWLQSCYALQWANNDNISDRTVSDKVASDLSMFKTLLQSNIDFVHTVPFLDRLGRFHSPVEIKADAARNDTLGFGCYLPLTGHWFGKSWSETMWFTPPSNLVANKIIYQLELFAISMAFKIFAPSLGGQVVILRSDNLAVVNSINKMSSHLEATMQLLHDLTLTCMSFQILVRATHIPGILNQESDLISRNKLTQFLEEFPRSREQTKEVATSLWPPSWKPSMLRRSSGKTEFRRTKRQPFAFSKKSATGMASQWCSNTNS